MQKRGRLREWVVMHVTIPLLALRLYRDTFREEIRPDSRLGEGTS